MKKIPFLLASLIFITEISNSCKKADQASYINEPPAPADPRKNNNPVNDSAWWTASAGHDQMLELPANEIILQGSYWYSGHNRPSNEVSVKWTKVSGPASYSLENKDSLRTKLSNLEEGVYSFELTVADARSAKSDKDTTSVIVGKLSLYPTEIVFNGVNMICPWYCGWEIEKLYSLIPSNKVFKIFVQRSGISEWKEVLLYRNDGDYEYHYWIEERSPDNAGMYNYGSLYIWWFPGQGTSASWNDLPDASVKIVY
ncbi:PKD domain-containing protein [Flavitalea antarctica]